MRAAVRLEVRWMVEMEHGLAYTRDISASGMYLSLSCVDGCEQQVTLGFAVVLPKRAGTIERLECEGRTIGIERQANGWFGVAIALLGYRFTGPDGLTH